MGLPIPASPRLLRWLPWSALRTGGYYTCEYNIALMSTTSKRKAQPRRGERRFQGPRADDPRVVRSRTAVLDAARTLFMAKGYAGTTMDEIAALAGVAKRTVDKNYDDKDGVFTQIW